MIRVKDILALIHQETEKSNRLLERYKSQSALVIELTHLPGRLQKEKERRREIVAELWRLRQIYRKERERQFGIVRPLRPLPRVMLWGGSTAEEVTAKLRAAAAEVTFEPRITGIYFLMRGDECVYVGKSVHILQRLMAHDIKFDRACFLQCRVQDLDCLERHYIDLLLPSDNRDERTRLLKKRRPHGVTNLSVLAK